MKVLIYRALWNDSSENEAAVLVSAIVGISPLGADTSHIELSEGRAITANEPASALLVRWIDALMHKEES